MNISAMLNENNAKLYERKRSLQRKEVTDTYKKNASYTQAAKNPVLAILENLLSGKTEKELYANQDSVINQTEEVVNRDSEFSTSTINKEEVNEHVLLEKIQAEEEIASATEDDFNRLSDLNLDSIPIQFLQNVNSFRFNGSGFNKNLDTLQQERNYNKAVTTYSKQMAMARQGFETSKPMYSISA